MKSFSAFQFFQKKLLPGKCREHRLKWQFILQNCFELEWNEKTFMTNHRSCFCVYLNVDYFKLKIKIVSVENTKFWTFVIHPSVLCGKLWNLYFTLLISPYAVITLYPTIGIITFSFLEKKVLTTPHCLLNICIDVCNKIFFEYKGIPVANSLCKRISWVWGPLGRGISLQMGLLCEGVPWLRDSEQTIE